MLLLMLIMSMMATMFPFLNHPLSMGFILIFKTLLIVIMSGIIMKSYWFSYIMFMMILGGGLILFIYMASVASNEKMTISKNMIMHSIMIMMMSLIFIFIPNKLFMQNYYMEKQALIYNEQLMSLNKLFNKEAMMITMMMVIYLMMTMVIINFIVKIFEGPMRMKN
nr:NADH dehydrogenase subunit 6 [Hypselosoma matsumurae]